MLMTSQNWLPSWLLEALLQASSEVNIWLVGGAPRNAFLGLDSVDYDFIVQEGARVIARKVANALAGDYYDLDSERDAGRVILVKGDTGRLVLDFARMRGENIEQDLRARDFTINALAIQIQDPSKIVDPTRGLQDLKDRVLRICSIASIDEDPIRALRAARLAIQYDFSLEPKTLTAIRDGGKKISEVSPERLRDELFRIFDLPFPGRALRLLDHLGLISEVFPELEGLRSLAQSPPHEFAAWEHTLSVIDHLGNILVGLGRQHNLEAASEMVIGEIAYRLGRFRVGINDHLEEELSHGRKIRQLIFLGALYHDAGKPACYELFDDRIRFIGHERISAELVTSKATRLKLSNREIRWLECLILNHLRPGQLEREDEVSRRAIYRFLRSTEDTCAEVVLLTLADLLGQRTPPIDQDLLAKRVRIARTLFEAYFETPRVEYHPILLLKGDEIALDLDIVPGPEIGRLLEALREAQATKEVGTRAEALEFVRTTYRLSTEGEEPKAG
jgi:tRNA nucleotidyltransferase/poly(A) polymerase